MSYLSYQLAFPGKSMMRIVLWECHNAVWVTRLFETSEKQNGAMCF